MVADHAFDLVIVGGGITGLATAYLALRQRPSVNVLVLEAGSAVGGKARTTVRDGYTVDWGPNGFLTNVSETLDLARELGLDDDLQPAQDAARRRYLYRDGGLRPLPSSPSQFLLSELLSGPGKLRALLELALAGRHAGEETVHAFLARHFGRELANALAGALVRGTTAGDPRQLSLDALFPRLRQMEADHGSLLRAMIASQRRAARARGAERGSSGERVRFPERAHTSESDGDVARPDVPPGSEADPSGPSQPPRPGRGRLTSFRTGGIQHLVTALERALGDRVRTGAKVVSLERVESGPGAGYTLTVVDGRRIRASRVVVTTPTPNAAELLEPHVPEAAEALRAIPYAGVRVFGLGYDRIDVPRVLDGFGFLPLESEPVRSLGVLWTSAIFPHRAPPGKVLLRVLAGGSSDPSMLSLSQEEALAAVRQDLQRTMGIVADPEFQELVVWPHAIPQYTLGHVQRVRRIDEALAGLPGVFVAGNAYRGVGVNDCVRDAARTVERLALS